MNIPDLINDFLVDVRNHDGFANDKNFDRVAAEVFKQKIKEVVEECAKICNDADKSTHPSDLADRIRALAAPGEDDGPDDRFDLGGFECNEPPIE